MKYESGVSICVRKKYSEPEPEPADIAKSMIIYGIQEAEHYLRTILNDKPLFESFGRSSISFSIADYSTIRNICKSNRLFSAVEYSSVQKILSAWTDDLLENCAR